MPEPRADMLPDVEATIDLSKQDVKPVIEIKEAKPVDEGGQLPPPGSKTPETLLLKSLQEEREKRRTLEEEIARLKSSTPAETIIEGDIVSDEGRLLQKRIDELEQELRKDKELKEQERVFGIYPQLLDKLDEFEKFCDDYPGVPLEKVAKLYVVDQGLEEKPSRKGLERPSSGPKTAPKSTISAEESEKMRIENPRLHQKMLREGKIDPDKY